MRTEEEKRIANRLATAKYYAKNKEKRAKYREENKERAKEYREKNKEKLKEAKVKYYADNKEVIKECQAKYRAENKEAKKEYMSKLYKNKVTHYVVYTHTNSSGAIYVGCGTNLRPYDFDNRIELWHEVFDNDCEIKIVAEFKDKESARELESSMINEIGLHNLINKNK